MGTIRNETRENQCSGGHTGPLCRLCDIYATKSPLKYHKKGEIECAKCPKNTVTQIIIFSVGLVFWLGLIAVEVWGVTDSMEEQLIAEKKIKP